VTLVQGLFLLGLAVVLVACVGFGAAVVQAALRADGGLVHPGRGGEELHRWAFYLHRMTGFAVFAFLLLHVLDLATYAVSPPLYDDLHEVYGTAPMRVFECGLLFAVLFHALNGLRLIAVDLADLGLEASRRALVAAAALTLALGAGGSAVILAPVLG
jgi:succinate dehydrogenase / fumarate reductase cytochrome b subunit